MDMSAQCCASQKQPWWDKLILVQYNSEFNANQRGISNALSLYDRHQRILNVSVRWRPGRALIPLSTLNIVQETSRLNWTIAYGGLSQTGGTSAGGFARGIGKGGALQGGAITGIFREGIFSELQNNAMSLLLYTGCAALKASNSGSLTARQLSMEM